MKCLYFFVEKEIILFYKLLELWYNLIKDGEVYYEKNF